VTRGSAKSLQFGAGADEPPVLSCGVGVSVADDAMASSPIVLRRVDRC